MRQTATPPPREPCPLEGWCAVLGWSRSHSYRACLGASRGLVVCLGAGTAPSCRRPVTRGQSRLLAAASCRPWRRASACAAQPPVLDVSRETNAPIRGPSAALRNLIGMDHSVYSADAEHRPMEGWRTLMSPLHHPIESATMNQLHRPACGVVGEGAVPAGESCDTVRTPGHPGVSRETAWQ